MAHIKSEAEKTREERARKARIAAFSPLAGAALERGRKKRYQAAKAKRLAEEQARMRQLGEILRAKGLLEAGVEYSLADLQRIYRESQV